jgi:hypothetical protein
MAASILITVWLFVWLYDLVFMLPDNIHLLVAIGWIITIYASYKWRDMGHNTYSKIGSIAVLAFVIFATFGFAIETLVDISPRFDSKYQNIILVLVQSVIASFFTSVIVAIPLVSVHRNQLFYVVLLASVPIIFIQIHGMYSSESLASKLILGFEIIFRVLAVWLVCVLASKALTRP